MIGCFVISDSKPLIDEKSRINYSNDCTSEESVNHIVQKIRYGLFSDNTVHDRDTANLLLGYYEDEDLRGKSYDLSLRVLLLCKKMGITARTYSNYDLFNDDTRNPNYFTIAEINGEKYIIDCSYRQFFTTRDNREDSSDHYPGRYMLMDEKRKEVAQTILKRGWIEATPHNLVAYIDGFMMADQRSDEETSSYTKRRCLTILLGDTAIISYPEIVDFLGQNPPDKADTLGITMPESEVERGD